MTTLKQATKNLLVLAGLRHPAKGVKISEERKAEILLSYKTPQMATFVETGTEYGMMVDALKDHFVNIHTVELGHDLYQALLEKFKDEPKVHLYWGDSADEIYNMLKHVDGPTLFWLDAHDTGAISLDNSPVWYELRAVFGYSLPGSVILIDDARHFGMKDVRAIKALAATHGYRCVIDEGLFIITPIL